MDTVVLHIDTLKIIAGLSPDDALHYLQAIVKTMEGGTAEVPPHLQIGWAFILNGIKSDMDNYAKKCERNRQNIAKRYASKQKDTTVYDRIPSNMTVYDNVAGSVSNYNTNTNTNTNTNNTLACVNNNNSTRTQVYPDTVDAVLKIARDAGVQMSAEQAQYYLAVRSSSDWHKKGYTAKIPVNQVGADLRVWMINERQYQNDVNNQQKNKDLFNL